MINWPHLGPSHCLNQYWTSSQRVTTSKVFLIRDYGNSYKCLNISFRYKPKLVWMLACRLPGPSHSLNRYWTSSQRETTFEVFWHFIMVIPISFGDKPLSKPVLNIFKVFWQSTMVVLIHIFVSMYRSVRAIIGVNSGLSPSGGTKPASKIVLNIRQRVTFFMLFGNWTWKYLYFLSQYIIKL